jgi:hypothetical protein
MHPLTTFLLGIIAGWLYLRQVPPCRRSRSDASAKRRGSGMAERRRSGRRARC